LRVLPVVLGVALFALSASGVRGEAAPGSVPMTVALAPGSAYGSPSDGITTAARVEVVGQTVPGMKVGVHRPGQGRGTSVTQADGAGHFTMMVGVRPGANLLAFGPVAGTTISDQTSLVVVCWPRPVERPFQGSPVAAGQPFARLIPNSQAYAPGVPPRPLATALSQTMVEDPDHPAFSANIALGLVFFGQFVDHDLTLNDTVAGQGPSVSATKPVDLRTPALDLDPVYGLGPENQPEFYTPDGLFFQLGTGGTDLLRDADGVAIIGDPRNDENGQIASIHLAFQKYHNTLMTAALNGALPDSLNRAQKNALFAMVRNRVIGFHQGLVANALAVAFSGVAISDDMPPMARIPVEFSAAVYRLGHTLVPNTIVVDAQGTRLSPTDPRLRGPGSEVSYTLLFGPGAQPAARFDALLSVTMHTLLIPLSPTQSGPGDLIGGNAANIGQGHIDANGVMHLDLAETNILRGREQHLPAGEEYLAMLDGRRYNPLVDGNTDLFVYMLREAAPLGHLGRVGGDVFHRTIGGILAADPFRYTNPQVYAPEQISRFRQANFASLLHTIGAPGF
jgi:hypothetical protein